MFFKFKYCIFDHSSYVFRVREVLHNYPVGIHGPRTARRASEHRAVSSVMVTAVLWRGRQHSKLVGGTICAQALRKAFGIHQLIYPQRVCEAGAKTSSWYRKKLKPREPGYSFSGHTVKGPGFGPQQPHAHALDH